MLEVGVQRGGQFAAHSYLEWLSIHALPPITNTPIYRVLAVRQVFNSRCWGDNTTVAQTDSHN